VTRVLDTHVGHVLHKVTWLKCCRFPLAHRQ
jgi:hypothetical protein